MDLNNIIAKHVASALSKQASKLDSDTIRHILSLIKGKMNNSRGYYRKGLEDAYNTIRSLSLHTHSEAVRMGESEEQAAAGLVKKLQDHISYYESKRNEIQENIDQLYFGTPENESAFVDGLVDAHQIAIDNLSQI